MRLNHELGAGAGVGVGAGVTGVGVGVGAGLGVGATGVGVGLGVGATVVGVEAVCVPFANLINCSTIAANGAPCWVEADFAAVRHALGTAVPAAHVPVACAS